MTLAEAIGVRLKKLLDERGLSQYYLYKEGGITRSTVSFIVRAKKGAAKVDTIYQICSTLGITLKDFFDDDVFEQVTD